MSEEERVEQEPFMGLGGERMPKSVADAILPGRLYQGPKEELANASAYDVVLVAAEEVDLPRRHVRNAESRKRVVVAKLPLQDARMLWREAFGWQRKVRGVAYDLSKAVRTGRRVLVVCNMGLNRSGLICGLVLRYLGDSGEAAVRRVQTRRYGALQNQSFAEAVREMDLVSPGGQCCGGGDTQH